MSRDDGFPVADVDSSYLDDPKMREMWQRLQDPERMARAVLLHAATVLASWRQGERVSVTQAAPVWLIADPELIGVLQAVHLLDRRGKIPAVSWTEWFGPAFTRREARRESGRAGGYAKAQRTSGDATATLQRTHGDALPVRPSVPSVPTGLSVPSVIPNTGAGSRARGGDPRPFGEAMLDNGMDPSIIKRRSS